jgi:predicted ArsR family transcriptional regulator
MTVDGYTIKELADMLKIRPAAVKMRLKNAGITPITREAVYPKSAYEVIRDVPGKGRPTKKPKDQEPPTEAPK